jgi:hypothetical protein
VYPHVHAFYSVAVSDSDSVRGGNLSRP